MKACALIVLAGCSWTGVVGSGKAKREVRPVAAFDEIDISGAVDTEIAIAADSRVEISGDDNLVPLVTTKVDGTRLEIDTQKTMRPKLPLVAHITVPRLTAVRVSGSSDVSLHGVHDDSLELSVHGSGNIRGDGAVHQLRIDVNGSGDLDLDQLAAERASVRLSGSGDVAVAASQALDVHISGSGDVTYRGDPPELKKHITGSGDVVKK